MKITIDFIDGPYDGSVTFDDADNPAKDLTALFAWNFYQRTKGTVGHWGGGLSIGNQERVMQQEMKADSSHTLYHEYHVIESFTVEGGLYIKAKYTTVPRPDETTTWVIAFRREIESEVVIALGGLPLSNYEYNDNSIVTIHASIHQFIWSPPPEHETPLTGKRATWKGNEYKIVKATIEEWTEGNRSQCMPTLVLKAIE